MSNGMTLIELLIAMLISLFILSMVTTIYVASEKNQQIQIALTTIQENARIAIESLRIDLHLAGNMGCGRLRADFPLKNVDLTPANKIIATEHTITIRGASAEKADLLETMQAEDILYVSSEPRFKVGDVVMISNCDSAEVFSILHADLVNQTTQKIIADKLLSQRYPKASSLSKFINKIYFIENACLYFKDGNKPSQELIHGIKAMDVTSNINTVAIKLTLLAENGLQKEWFVTVNLVAA
jgi:prepilin-type N-terminal cleavage/methylation domain-containing protein